MPGCLWWQTFAVDSSIRCAQCLNIRQVGVPLLLQGDRDIKSREADRRKNTVPSTTLFVVNFDVVRTRERDLSDLYERYGRLKRVQVRFACAGNQHIDGRQSQDMSVFLGMKRLKRMARAATASSACFICIAYISSMLSRVRDWLLRRSRRTLHLSRCDTTPCLCPLQQETLHLSLQIKRKFAFVEVQCTHWFAPCSPLLRPHHPSRAHPLWLIY